MNLLKLLYLIRYVTDDIPAKLDNLVILQADSMDSNGVRFIALIDQIDNMPHKYEGLEDSDGRCASMMS